MVKPAAFPGQSRTRSSYGGGFTLVELLVVISIIALLVSLLLPSLVAARVEAYRVACQSNEKNLELAFSGYMSDYNQSYPYIFPAQTPIGAGTYLVFGSRATNTDWADQLLPYIGNQRRVVGCVVAGLEHTTTPACFACPANPYITSSHADNGTPTAYGMNSGLGNGNTSVFPGNYSKSGNIGNQYDPYYTPSQYQPPLLYDQVVHPSALMLVADATSFPDSSVDPTVPNIYGHYGQCPGGNWFSVYLDPLYWYKPDMSEDCNLRHHMPGVYVANLMCWNNLMCDGTVKSTNMTTAIAYGDAVVFNTTNPLYDEFFINR